MAKNNLEEVTKGTPEDRLLGQDEDEFVVIGEEELEEPTTTESETAVVGEITPEFYADQQKFAEDLFGELQCDTCNYFNGDGTCAAFDGFIPMEILSGQFVHDKVHPLQIKKEILYSKMG